MRACEGCRRRKIKCDAATTNSWPCGACVRLKQNCIPPTLSYDRDHIGNTKITGFEKVLDFDTSSSGDEDYSHRQSVPHSFEIDSSNGQLQSHHGPYNDVLAAFQTPPYSEGDLSRQDISYDDIPGLPLHVAEGSFREQSSFEKSPGPPLASPSSSLIWDEGYAAAGLSSILGELKIDENGVGMFL